VEKLPQKADAFYASHVPATLSECIVVAAEHGQSVKAELQLLRGMLVKMLDDLKKRKAKVGKEARAEIMELIKEIRATLKVESELTAREKGMLHPSALPIFGAMIVKIVTDSLPDEKQRTIVAESIETRINQIPVKKLG
jgi:hypothetical protein